MTIDPVYRLDLYGLSSKLSQRHWAHTVANTYLSWLLSHVAACLGLSDVEAEFDQWIANTQARRAAADPGASHAGP